MNWVQAAPSLKNIRVLVVDDQPDAREVVALILERCGAQVRVAASAAEAFGILEQESAGGSGSRYRNAGRGWLQPSPQNQGFPPREGWTHPCHRPHRICRGPRPHKATGAGFHRHVPKPLQPLELITAVACWPDRGETGGRSYSPTGGRRRESIKPRNGDEPSTAGNALAGRAGPK